MLARSPCTAVSTRPPPACTSATWCCCSPCAASSCAGHQPIALVGGATGLIGDPSGKSAERVLNSREVVAGWVERIRREVSRFLDFSPGPDRRADR